MSRPICIYTFHNNTTAPSEGEILTNSNADEITINIRGSATSFIVKFYGKVDSEATWQEVTFCNLKDLSFSTTVTETYINSNWNTSISGFSYFKVEVESISGGDLTIVGRVISI